MSISGVVPQFQSYLYLQCRLKYINSIRQEMRQERIIRLKERGLQHGENKREKDSDLTKTDDFV